MVLPDLKFFTRAPLLCLMQQALCQELGVGEG